MASSDDEEIVLQTVTNYYFIDDDELPISFSVLPVHFGDVEKNDSVLRVVFLHGTTDGGLQKVFKQVIAWKLDLEGDHPKIIVLSKDNQFINLLKPRKSYFEGTIRTVMVTLQLLHFLRKNPQASEKSLLEHLRFVFSTFEVRPSYDDWSGHLSLMKLFYEKDEVLANSQLLLGFIQGKPRKRFHGSTFYLKSSFIASDDEVDEGVRDDDDTELFDSVCAICDNGGDLLCCEGPCLRSFHASRKAGDESSCESLGYTQSKIESIQNFLCKHCLYKQHQCFCCGKLGSSDKAQGAEVYPCVSATCGHFYHPKCVAELLFPGNEDEASALQKQIIAGESFTCPVHKCVVCKQGENKEVRDLQFAMCRRCPKSYHRKCLPRKISFKDIEEENIIQRAWEKLLPNRILIYCSKHKIEENLGTPIRNHIKFPENPKKRISDLQKNKVKTLEKRKSLVYGEGAQNQSIAKPFKVINCVDNRFKEKVVRSVTQHTLGTQKREKHVKGNSRFEFNKAERTVAQYNLIPAKEGKRIATTTSVKRAKLPRSSFPDIDSETEANVLALFKETSLSMDDIIRERSIPSTHAYGTRHIERTITLGKVEASVQAVQTALKKLENGGSLEDAKAVCEPDVLKQLYRWREKLRVYLAPFLHGMRYTSFGRHFTKVDKLKQVVDKLHWYVLEGDTVVDFCCGANDFSILMKEKLDATGKKCNFKNYDIIQPKNDFSFERRDWMTVKPMELPTGSKLIMGLNPPFGVKAALANKFINQALIFKPKLLVLIVPKETERLDKKNSPYDLIWEDDENLSGKSFYLPGSVDVNDKQIEQWNVRPPSLYLWSRPDWTSTHKEIAKCRGHTDTEDPSAENEFSVERYVHALPAENHMGQELLKNYSTLDARHAPTRKEERQSSGNCNRKACIENDGGSLKRKISNIGGMISEERNLSGSCISPDKPERGSWSRSHLPSEFTGTPFERPSNPDPYINSGKNVTVVTGANDILNDINDVIDENTGRCTAAEKGMFNRNSNVSQGGRIENYDCGIQSSEPHFVDYTRDNKPKLDGYSKSSDADFRAIIRNYGTQDQNEQSQCNRISFGVSDAGFRQSRLLSSPSYGAPSSSTMPSAMDHLAWRPDETNYAGPGIHVPLAPFPGRSETTSYNKIHGARDRPPNSTEYAPGPHPSFPHPDGSCGWLDD